MKSKIIAELKRLFPNHETQPVDLDDFEEYEIEILDALPEDIRAFAEFLVYDDAWNHPDFQEAYGLYLILEINSSEGTFGQLREIVEDYKYGNVIMIGADTFVDVKGEVGPPGAVVSAISYDLDDASQIAPSLLDLLKASNPF